MTPSFPPLREELRGIEPYGAPQLSLEQAPVQLNVNENPYGPSAEAAADIARAVGEAAVSLNRYPDREFVELRSARLYVRRTQGPVLAAGLYAAMLAFYLPRRLLMTVARGPRQAPLGRMVADAVLPARAVRRLQQGGGA